MVLVVSHAGDGHVAPVASRLSAEGADWTLLDTDDYPGRVTIVDGPAGCVLQLPGRRVDLAEVSAVWWRRPRPPLISGRAPSIAAWAQRQAFTALDSALCHMEAIWINHPRCNRRAEDKAANLRRAVAHGMKVPDWCVTNDPGTAGQFFARHEAIVAKPAESAWVTDEHSVWTRRVEDPAWLERIGPEPYLLQRFIDKTEDVRAVVVGDEVYAVSIDSQSSPDTRVDLRAGRLRDLPHHPTALPAEVSASLRALTKSLQLRFAAVDLVVDHNGCHWFLELNPNGQWAWLEELTDLPIADALVRALT